VSVYFEDRPEYLAQMAADPPLPRVVQLELTAECNLRCVFCPLHSETARERAAHERRVSLDDLQTHLHPLLANAYEVELTGFGEIFCHPQLLAALRHFKSLGLTVNATSNGTLWQPEQLREIVDEGLIDLLCVSLDAGAADTYARLRVGGDFTRVVANLHALAAAKTQRDVAKPELHLSFLSMKDNLGELPAVIELARTVGASEVIIQGLCENEAMRGRGTANEESEKQTFAEAAECARRAGVRLELWYQSQPTVVETDAVARVQLTAPPAAERPLIKDCPYPWERVFVKSNLDVQVCATLWEKLVMGNLRRQTIEEIWRGDGYRALRRALASPRPAPECFSCNTKPWREPLRGEEMLDRRDFGEPLHHQLGQGFYVAERDRRGQSFRWTTAHGVFYLRNTRRPFLDIEMVTHPRMKPTWLRLLVNGLEIDRLRSDRLGEPPLRFALPASSDEVLCVESIVDEPCTPVQVGDGDSRRPLGAQLFYARLSGDAAALSDRVRVGKNCGMHLGHGFFAPEEGNAKLRWTGERASFVIAGGRGELLEIELWTPGAPRNQQVDIFIDGQRRERVDMPARPGRRLARVPLGAPRPWRLVTLDCQSLYAPGNGDTRLLGVMFAGARVIEKKRRAWWRRA